MEKLALRDIFARMVASRDDARGSEAGSAPDATVLIVDDSRTAVHALQRMLVQAGYLTLTAADGAQAVALAKQHRPDLVLMDIVMPVMNGFEATRALALDPDTAAVPVILISGTEQATERIWGTRLGAKGFLAKPIAREDLLATVSRVITAARRARERQHPVAAAPSVDALRR